MPKWIASVFCLLILSAAALSLPARENFAPPRDRIDRSERARVSLDQAVARVRQQTGGRILSAETISRQNKVVHRVKVLLPSGHVRIYHIDADGG